MGTAIVTLPGGKRAKVSFETQAQLDEAVALLERQHVGNLGNAVEDVVSSVGSSMIAAPVSGLAGIGTGIGNALGLTDAQPADVVRSVGDAMTYRPRTTAGEIATNVATYPFQKLGELGDYLGGKTAEKTGSPAAGATVNTAIQMAPAIIAAAFKARGGKPAAAAASTPEDLAKAYVANHTALDWNSLSDSVKARLVGIAEDSRSLAGLDPAALERQARLESLPKPVPATRGQLTRDPVQLRNEGNVSATTAGKPIRDVYVEQNRALVENLDILKGRQRGTATTPEQAGLTIQGSARSKLAAVKANVKKLYQDAKAAGELEAPVSVEPLQRMIDASPDVTHLGWVESWLKKTKAVAAGEDGKPVSRPVTIGELEDLRQAAVARAMNGGTEGYYAGKVISEIDQITEGAGGKAYAAARAARKKQALEFEDQGSVARLVENKSRTDRAVALEDTWRKTVIGGSIEDLRNVKRSLLTEGNGKARFQGRKAWQDLRAQTLDYIRNEATKSVARFEDGTPNVTPAAMERAIKAIGRDKLDEIFGPNTSRALDQIMQATRDIKTEPPAGFKGSPTFANAIAFLERNLNRVPVIGNVGAGVVHGVAKLNEMGKSAREVRAATQTPLAEAEAAARRAAVGTENRAALTRAAPVSSASLERERKRR